MEVLKYNLQEHLPFIYDKEFEYCSVQSNLKVYKAVLILSELIL